MSLIVYIFQKIFIIFSIFMDLTSFLLLQTSMLPWHAFDIILVFDIGCFFLKFCQHFDGSFILFWMIWCLPWMININAKLKLCQFCHLLFKIFSYEMILWMSSMITSFMLKTLSPFCWWQRGRRMCKRLMTCAKYELQKLICCVMQMSYMHR